MIRYDSTVVDYFNMGEKYYNLEDLREK